MSDIKITNARQLIAEALINYYKKHGACERKRYFAPGIDSLKLTREQLADKHSDGTFTKYRALTGSIINELEKAGKIEIKQELEKRKAPKPVVLKEKPIDQRVEKRYPKTAIGDCLKAQHQKYVLFLDKELSFGDYFATLRETLIGAIHIVGGAFLEKLSLEVAKKVYGRRLIADSDKIRGGNNDHGIDGELKVVDEFGIEETIFIQSKLSEKGERAIRNFVGALRLEGGDKGIFVTASTIDTRARAYFKNKCQQHKIIIIGKEELSELLLKHKIGVTHDQSGNVLVDDTYFMPE
jgi:restriction endonuclease Mrr